MDPGPSARGQPSSCRDAVGVFQMLPRDVRARGAHVVPGQRLDEVAAGPLEYRAPSQVDTASRFGFGVSNERDQPAFGAAAQDDVDVIRKDRHLMDVDLAPVRRFTDCRSDHIGISTPDRALP